METDSEDNTAALRALARFTFVHEERDGEVRLLLRDASAREVALAFRAAGARLISIAGERPPPAGQPGDHTLRYFFDLDKTVYMVNIESSSSAAASVAGVYPSAGAIESELRERLGLSYELETTDDGRRTMDDGRWTMNRS